MKNKLFVILFITFIVLEIGSPGIKVFAADYESSTSVKTKVGISFIEGEEHPQSENNKEQTPQKNDKNKYLPKTGESKSNRLIFLGISSILIFFFILLSKKRKKKDQDDVNNQNKNI